MIVKLKVLSTIYLGENKMKQPLKEMLKKIGGGHLLNEARGKSFVKVWKDVERKNAQLKVDGINKANSQALKNVKKLIGTKIWDSDKNMSGKITGAEWKKEKDTKATFDKSFFSVSDGKQDFWIQITYEDGTKTVWEDSPWIHGDTPYYLDK